MVIFFALEKKPGFLGVGSYHGQQWLIMVQNGDLMGLIQGGAPVS